MSQTQITTATKKLLKLNKKIRAVSGGTGASKTYSIIMILIDWAQTNQKQKIDVVSESFPHLEAGAIQDFKQIMTDREYWNDNNWNETKHIYTFNTGTTIKFLSVDKMGKAHGPRRDVLFLNEGNYMAYPIVDQLIVRTRKIVWIDWNPTADFWFDDEILGKREIDFMGENGNYPPLIYKDNEGLTQEEIEEIESRKHNKAWWRVYGLGLKGELEQKIYRNWKFVDEIPHEAKLQRYGLNFGFTNHPCSLIALYYYNGGYIIDGILYGKGITNQNIADTLKNQPRALVVADSAEPKSIDEIKGYGINIIGVKKKAAGGVKSVIGSEKSFVKWSINAVQQEKISITKRSINEIREYRNYMWQVDRDGKILNEPAEPFHYSMDSVRYAICSLAPIINKRDFMDTIPRFPIKEKKNPAV